MKKFKMISLLFLALYSCGPSHQTEGQLDFTEINAQLNEIDNYPTVTIHGQTWLAKNLAVTTFSNGDTIFYASSNEEWTHAADNNIPAWTYFNFWEPYYEDMFEVRFYNWHAVNDPRGLAPEGWRVPSLEDWDNLLRHFIISEEKIKELKSEENWEMDGRGNNASGFNAKAYGHCDDYAGFANDGISTSWWASDEYNSEEAWHILLNEYNNVIKHEWVKGAGLSVRLVKETD